MKYIMFETTEGRKFPVIFPDHVPHVLMAAALKAIDPKTGPHPVSAGFVSIGNCDVHGESESLGGLAHNETDAARIVIGDSVAFMPDALAASTFRMYKEKFGG